MTEDQPTPHALRAERRALILWTLLARAYHQSLNDIQHVLQPHELTVMEFDVLAHIDAAPGLTQQHLAERLLVTKGNVTYQLTKLEQQHLIERRTQQRCNHLHLTDQGRHIVRRAIATLKALHTRQYAHLTSQEQDQLAVLLRKALDMPAADTRRVSSAPHAPLPEV